MNNNQNNNQTPFNNNNQSHSSVTNPFDMIQEDYNENAGFKNSINIVPLDENYPPEQNQVFQTQNTNIPEKNIAQQPTRTYLNDFQRKNLLMAFVGFNYEKFCTQKINLAALVFAEYYLFYRRMNFLALVLLIGRTLLFVFAYPLLSFIFNFLLAFTFNKIYLNFAANKIKSLEDKNPTLSYNELREKVLEYGDPKQSSAVIAFIMNMLISLIAIIIIGLADITTGPLSNFNIFTIIRKNPKFNGTLQYAENVNINEYYQILMPEDIVFASSKSSIEGTLKNNAFTTENTCNYKFNVLKGYKDSKDLAIQMSKYYQVSKPKELQINSITWYYLSYQDNGKVNIYLTSRNNRVYIYEFKAEKNADSTYCEKYNTSIINSIFYN